MHPARNRWLRFGSLLLLAVFVLPGCFTMMVWHRDHGHRHELERPVQTLARPDGACIALYLPKGAVARLQGAVPGLSVDQPWLQLRPRGDRALVAKVVEHGKEAKRDPLTLSDMLSNGMIVFGQIDDRSCLTVTLILQGQEVALEVVAAPPPGDGLVALSPHFFAVLEEDPADPGMPVVLRALLTPPAVVADVVLLPVAFVASLIFL